MVGRSSSDIYMGVQKVQIWCDNKSYYLIQRWNSFGWFLVNLNIMTLTEAFSYRSRLQIDRKKYKQYKDKGKGKANTKVKD